MLFTILPLDLSLEPLFHTSLSCIDLGRVDLPSQICDFQLDLFIYAALICKPSNYISPLIVQSTSAFSSHWMNWLQQKIPQIWAEQGSSAVSGYAPVHQVTLKLNSGSLQSLSIMTH